MHHFTISICETVPQFNNSLATQFNEGEGTNEIEQEEYMSLKIQEAT